ncbi:hypothetical protein FOCC_FOCC000264 [Frankliniella occidentalis]|nr:hypothetical protein FOCC_FOCC000264 [Frankliniella occidentalis]
MAEKCNYRDLKDELIRDRIIVGILNAQLSAAMQMDENIDLPKTKERVLQAEGVSRQLPTLRNGRGDAGTAQVHAAYSNKGKGKKPFKSNPNPKFKPQDKKTPQSQSKYPAFCWKCGERPSHPFSECPAKNTICAKCRRKGHRTSMCKAKVNELNVEDEPHAEEVTYYLDRIEATPSKALRVNITSNNKVVCWKLDCGADIPILGNKHLELFKPIEIVPPNCKVLLAGNVPAKITGKIKVNFSWKGVTYNSWVYIMPNQKEPLLSRDLAIRMGLISVAPEVLSVSQVSKKPEESFPEVFEGLGLMGEDYLIRLEKGAIPYAVTQSRRISVPLFEPTKKAIKELIQLGAIEEVSKPTPWCAAAVPVLKPDGSVRITVDYTQLNKYVLRECHEMPTVDECLATIGKEAKLFNFNGGECQWD